MPVYGLGEAFTQPLSARSLKHEYPIWREQGEPVASAIGMLSVLT